MTLGHEFAARVAEVGKEVKSLRPRDKVAQESHISCGICCCRTGNMHICQDMPILGLQTREGSFAKYIGVPEVTAYGLDSGVS
jgi:threonine 3-dehydrogenase